MYIYEMELRARNFEQLGQIERDARDLARGLDAVQREERQVADGAQRMGRELRDGIGGRAQREMQEMRSLLRGMAQDLQGIGMASREAARALGEMENRMGSLRRQGGGAGGGRRGRGFGSRADMLDAVDYLPGMGMASSVIYNPYAGAALAAAGVGYLTLGQGAQFDRGMARVNTTAGLDSAGRDALAARLQASASRNGTQATDAPLAFERILSQVGDVQRSLDVFDVAQRASRATFTDLDVVAQGLGRAASAVGPGSNAQELANQFMVAKRLGAGEFADFSNYIPGLLAQGKVANVGQADAIAQFSYLTAKGFSGDAAATLQSNLYSALSRPDVLRRLQASGVDTGRGIMGTLSGIRDRFNATPEGRRETALYDMGIQDVQAKQAVMAMIGEFDRLADTLKQVRNSAGELDRQYEQSRNVLDEFGVMWSRTKNSFLTSAPMEAIRDGLVTLNDRSTRRQQRHELLAEARQKGLLPDDAKQEAAMTSREADMYDLFYKTNPGKFTSMSWAPQQYKDMYARANMAQDLLAKRTEQGAPAPAGGAGQATTAGETIESLRGRLAMLDDMIAKTDDRALIRAKGGERLGVERQLNELLKLAGLKAGQDEGNKLQHFVMGQKPTTINIGRVQFADRVDMDFGTVAEGAQEVESTMMETLVRAVEGALDQLN